jgi:hypothetical protein
VLATKKSRIDSESGSRCALWRIIWTGQGRQARDASEHRSLSYEQMCCLGSSAVLHYVICSGPHSRPVPQVVARKQKPLHSSMTNLVRRRGPCQERRSVARFAATPAHRGPRALPIPIAFCFGIRGRAMWLWYPVVAWAFCTTSACVPRDPQL